MNTRRHVSTAVAFLFAFVVISYQMLRSIDNASSSNTVLMLLVVFSVAAYTRKRAIGGWLLYCYIVMLYLAKWFPWLLSAIEQFLDSSHWPNLYAHVAFVALALATYAATAYAMWAMLLLLFARTPRRLELTRRALVMTAISATCAYLFAQLVAIDEDAARFFGAMPFAVALSASCINLYFKYSQRVRKVFAESSWPAATKEGSNSSPSSPAGR
jgi:hypothetical protein